jgi:hypothetical protein
MDLFYLLGYVQHMWKTADKGRDLTITAFRQTIKNFLKALVAVLPDSGVYHYFAQI